MYDYFPQELRLLPQWVVWKFGEPRPNGKRPKVPYTPTTGQKAAANQPETWGTYEEACKATRKGFDGVGFMFLAGQGYIGIDLDACREGDATVHKWARDIIDRLNSYTELSPSFTGVHIIIKGKIPGERRRKGNVEIYDGERFFTVTGRTMTYGSRPIAERQDALNSLYIEIFGEETEQKRPAPSKKERPAPGARPTPELTRENTALIEHMGNASRHGERFKRLWAGNWQGYGSQSDADIALCGILAYWTQGNEDHIDELFRLSGLYRDKWDTRRGDSAYGEQTILKAINGATSFYAPNGERKRAYRTVPYSYPYQRAEEQPGEREQMLQARAEEIREQVAGAIDQGEQVTGIASPPGVGKSFTVAAWGIDQDIAYLVPRHEQEQSVPTLQQYRIMLPPSAETCDNYELHNTLARAGYNTILAHQHSCIYRKQFEQKGSAVYQIAHAMTTYPAEHRAIIVDEFSLTDWYTRRDHTFDEIRQAKETFNKNTPAYHLLRAFQIVLGDVDSGQVLQGKPLFDTLDRHLEGRLQAIIETLSSDYKATDKYPLWTRGNTDRVVLPHLWNTLNDEAVRWQYGGDWNSYMRVAGSTLCLTEPRQFQARDKGTVPPLVILDATMHKDFLKQWAGQEVKLYRPEIAPPPHTRHVGVRLGRYGKYNLTSNKTYQRQVIEQTDYLLNELCIEREKTGLITFKPIRDKIGNALRIPTGQRLHFFGSRGSNALEHCETLLIIGTPALSPDDLYRYARAVYHDDPVPLVEASEQTEAGEWRYQDRRVQELAEYISQAELTQCAHRNRPLRYDGRTVITFCKGEIDYLPLTDEPVTFPTLTEKKAEQERQALAAIDRIMERGEKLTVRALLAECPMDNNRAQEYIQRFK